MISGEDLKAMGYFDMFENQEASKDQMQFYSDWAETLVMTEGTDRLFENVLGLVGEAGEVAEKVKKVYRDKTRFTNEDILNELGDVLYYLTVTSHIFGGSLKRVAELNMEKLNGRKERGTLKGSGDKR
jgi:NTP pyrophosphatase (non-canonical NTP hydrolase)